MKLWQHGYLRGYKRLGTLRDLVFVGFSKKKIYIYISLFPLEDIQLSVILLAEFWCKLKLYGACGGGYPSDQHILARMTGRRSYRG